MLEQMVNYMGFYLNGQSKIDYKSLVLTMYYDQLQGMVRSMFKWEGLPESVDADYLEKTLFNHGKAIFFEDETLGYLALECTNSSLVNVYGEPLAYTAGGNGNEFYQKEYKAKDCVVIKNNPLKQGSALFTQLFAFKIANIDLSQTINLNVNKTPFIISCSENERLSMINLYKQYEGNAPLVVVSDAMQMEKINVLKTNAPYLVNELQDAKNQALNEFLSYVGLNNANTDKKERLITDEVNANNEFIEMNLNKMLDMRKKACKQINAKYGLNVSVKLNIEELEEPEEPEGGVE